MKCFTTVGSCYNDQKSHLSYTRQRASEWKWTTHASYFTKQEINKQELAELVRARARVCVHAIEWEKRCHGKKKMKFFLVFSAYVPKWHRWLNREKRKIVSYILSTISRKIKIKLKIVFNFRMRWPFSLFSLHLLWLSVDRSAPLHSHFFSTVDVFEWCSHFMLNHLNWQINTIHIITMWAADKRKTKDKLPNSTSKREKHLIEQQNILYLGNGFLFVIVVGIVAAVVVLFLLLVCHTDLNVSFATIFFT